MSGYKEQIWFKDPLKWMTDLNSLVNFIPDPHSSLEAQLNDAFRFSVYFGVLIAVLRYDLRALFFPIFVGMFTIFIYNYEQKKNNSKNQLLEKLDVSMNKHKQYCSAPTKNNPMMNVLISDYKDFPNKPKACQNTLKSVKNKIDNVVNSIPMDSDNIYGKSLNDLQFYTMPATTIPNAQSEFANWLYNPGKTKKEEGVSNLNWR